MAYRAYVTDALQIISENTAYPGHYYGGKGRHMKERYFDVIRPQREETRTADEIIKEVTSKLKGGVRP